MRKAREEIIARDFGVSQRGTEWEERGGEAAKKTNLM